MKKLLSMFLALMLFGSTTVTALAESFQVSTDKDMICVGENVTVTVRLNETMTGSYRNIQGQLKYDTDRLAYVSHEMGEVYAHYKAKNMSEKKYFTFSNTDMTQGGFSEIPAGTIATVVFKAKEGIKADKMDSVFHLSMSVQDINGHSEKVDAEASVSISKIDIKNKTASLSAVSYTYNGSAKKPTVSIAGLKAGTDFTVSYKNNVNAGTATVTITGKGNCTGTITKTFSIKRAAISSKTATMSLSASSYTYNKAYRKPAVTVKYGSRTLKNGTDYTVSYENNLYPGTATATITGKGNYSGSLKKSFTIKVPDLAAVKKVTVSLYGHDDLQAAWSKVSGATGYYVYYKKSTAKNYALLGTTTGTSYKKANLADGAAYSFRIYPYVKINGKVYKDSSYKTSSNVYTLKKVSTPKVSKKSKKYIRVKWTNIQGETGYQIYRSTKKSKGFKLVKTVKSTTAKSTTIKTTRNKTYYYKIRAYKTVNGKKIYSPWSSVKKYKLK